MDLSGQLLERAARATPATVEEHLDGWWLRHTAGDAWWAGAVLAHEAATGNRLAERITAVERFYAKHETFACFQVCPGCPAGLDSALAERGYRWQAPISLRILDAADTDVLARTGSTAGSDTGANAAHIAGPASTSGLSVRAHTGPHADWLSVLAATGSEDTDVDRETALLDRASGVSHYVTVYADGEPVAIGRAVADDGWAGVFHMATTPQARRRGAARLVLASAAWWACQQDTPLLYLQVERSNVAACRLYDAAGFTELATYHYRVQPTAAMR